MLRSLISQLGVTFCLILIIHSNPAYSDDENRTVYDILQDYDLPVGLLPEGVTGYELDHTTGNLSVTLSDTCSFSEGKYQLKYEATVKCYISNGKLSSLEGVSVKFSEVWVNIVEIVRRGNDIDFSIGIGKAAFPVEYFEESPQCGCGMNCSRRPSLRKLMANR